MKTIVERLGQYAADLAFDELGEPVLDYAKRIVLDSLACVFGRLDSEPARIVRNTAEEDLRGIGANCMLTARDNSIDALRAGFRRRPFFAAVVSTRGEPMKQSNTFHSVVAATLLLGAANATNAAQAPAGFPSKALRIVVPFPPGGGTDITARIVGQRLSESLRQPVVVDNRAGAGGMIGTELVAKAAPDGYTMLTAVTSHAINPSLYRKVNYDPLGDFAPVSLALSFPYVLVIHPSVPANSVKELISVAKAQPGKLTFASSGIGLSNHMAGELFKATAGVEIVHVPYKGGGPALNDVMAGNVTMIFGTVLETLPLARAGKLRALAVTTPKRASFAPDLPTVAEAGGLPGFQATGWYSFLVPAATPREIVMFLNREIVRILESGSVHEHLTKLGGEPWPTTPEAARDFIAAEVKRWSKLIAQIGIKAE